MRTTNQFTTTAFSPTVWEQTPDGFLRVKARVLKECVMPYARAEFEHIPPELDGVDPILVYVPLESITSAETLRTLEGAQVVTPDHIWVTPDNAGVSKGNVAGAPRIDGPYQEVDLLVTDPTSIESIMTREIGEISGGYLADVLFESGEFQGQPYHAKQMQIAYNHIAVIAAGTGRAGSEVRILNKQQTNKDQGGKQMEIVKVKLRNGAYINTDEEGARALEASDTETSKSVEKLMESCETAKTEAEQANASLEEVKGELSVYKEKLDDLLADETIEKMAEGMIAEQGEAEEIIENAFPGDDDETKKKKEEAMNSIKGLRGTKLHTAVLNAVGMKVENSSPAEVKGMFRAMNSMAVRTDQTGKKVAGMKAMNSQVVRETVGAGLVVRDARSRLGLPSKS